MVLHWFRFKRITLTMWASNTTNSSLLPAEYSLGFNFTNATTTSSTTVNGGAVVALQDGSDEVSTTTTTLLTRHPQHVILDDDFLTTAADISAAPDDYDDSGGSPAVGIAVGVSIALIIVLALVIALILFIVRKKRLRKKADIKILENPQYGEDPDPVRRRSSAAERTLSTLPTAIKYNANNNSLSDSNAPSTNGRKQKAPPPRPPIYRPPSSGRDSATKKAAPLPPDLAMSDLYEKDSPNASTENLTYSARNTTAEHVPDDEPATNHLQPLLDDDNGGLPKPPERKSPRKSPKKFMDEGRGYGVLQDENDDDANEPMSDTKKSLLSDKAKSESHSSLDSYDRTKNPFFAD